MVIDCIHCLDFPIKLHFTYCIKSKLRVIIPREEQGIKEFDDKEFLTRKTDKENKEFTSIKKALLRLKLSFWRGKNTKICYLKNIYA